jgi:hypothetical protein
MSVSRRALGGLARRAVGSATKALERLEKTVDDEKESSASRDRAAHRLLLHAFKWGEVFDPGLESREASGKCSQNELRDLHGEINRHHDAARHYRNQGERVCTLLYELEAFIRNSGVTLSENHRERLDMYRNSFKDPDIS